MITLPWVKRQFWLNEISSILYFLKQVFSINKILYLSTSWRSYFVRTFKLAPGPKQMKPLVQLRNQVYFLGSKFEFLSSLLGTSEPHFTSISDDKYNSGQNIDLARNSNPNAAFSNTRWRADIQSRFYPHSKKRIMVQVWLKGFQTPPT